MNKINRIGQVVLLGLFAILLMLPAAVVMAVPVMEAGGQVAAMVANSGTMEKVLAGMTGLAAVGISFAAISYASPEGPNGSGVSLAQSGVPQGLYGNAVLQPAQPTQAQAGFALGQSAVVVYVSTQTPAAVAANTSAEQALTVTGIQVGSVVYINKPTVQAGLGIVNVRVSGADAITVCFSNNTAGNVTPTAGEEYLVVEIRGPLVQTVALTFGTDTVPANGTREFSFTITPATGAQGLTTHQVAAGIPLLTKDLPSAAPAASSGDTVQQPVTREAGSAVFTGTPQTVILNKPTTDAGIGICGVRLSGNNVLVIRYCNTTAAGVNPADETYTFIGLRGVSLHQSIVAYTVDVGTLAATATITTAEQTVTVNGVATTDRIVGVSKPTAQAGLGIVGWRVTAANTVGITFGNPTAGGLTATADEHYTIWVDKSKTAEAFVVRQFNVAMAVASVAGDTVAEQTVTVTGLPAGCPVVVNAALADAFTDGHGDALPFGIGIVSARTSALNTLALGFINTTAAAIVPGTLIVTVLAAPADRSGDTDGVDGSAVEWPMDVQSVQVAELANSLQAALAAFGNIAGS